MNGEVLGASLISLHNIAFYQSMMKQMRDAIEADAFDAWKASQADAGVWNLKEDIAMMNVLTILAQATSQPAGGPPQDSFMRFMVPMLLALGVFYFFMIRGQRKERKTHANMLAALKRNDRIQTIGGILGTVVEARDTEVIVKVDESSNVKMRFNRAAIKEVLEQAPGN